MTLRLQNRSMPQRPVRVTARMRLAPRPKYRLQHPYWSDPNMHRAQTKGLTRVRMEAWRKGIDRLDPQAATSARKKGIL